MSSGLSIRQSRRDDLAAIAQLQARVFGPGRFARSAYRVREGAPPLTKFCCVGFVDGQLIASLNFTEVFIGGTSGALLLGPFVVDPDAGKKGLGGVLLEDALLCAKTAGVPLIVLVGDEPYYKRYGFFKVPAGQIVFPGPVAGDRILATENQKGALADFSGMIRASG